MIYNMIYSNCVLIIWCTDTFSLKQPHQYIEVWLYSFIDHIIKVWIIKITHYVYIKNSLYQLLLPKKILLIHAKINTRSGFSSEYILFFDKFFDSSPLVRWKLLKLIWFFNNLIIIPITLLCYFKVIWGFL